MGKLEDYEQYYNKYQELYGDKTVVFYQIGKFHEMYGLNNDTEKVGNIEEITQLLNIKLTRCKTAILENNRSNPLMAGFNSVSLDVNVDRLVDCGYTVVVINQTTKPKGKIPPKREVVYIKSPSTSVSMTSARDPYMVAVYVNSQYNRSTKKSYEYFGMTAIDITTGQSYWFESNSTPEDPNLAIDDLTRFFQTFNPVEIVLVENPEQTETIITPDQVDSWGFSLSKEGQGVNLSFADIVNNIKPTVHMNYQGFQVSGIKHNKIETVTFQEQYLSEYFDVKQSPLEQLGLYQAPMAATSLVYLLKFCSDHNKALLSHLVYPQHWSNDQTMSLETSSVFQLNIIEGYYQQVKQNSVFALLKRSLKTPMGCRLLRSRLLNCSTVPGLLNKRYSFIDEAIKIPTGDLKAVRTQLAKLRDLDRLHRKITLNTLSPAELHTTDQCYNTVEIIGCSLKHIPIYDDLMKESLAFMVKYRKMYADIIDIEQAGCCTVLDNLQGTIFKRGYSDEIDQVSDKLVQYERIRTITCEKLSDTITKGSNCCAYKVGEDVCYISISKAQYTKLKSQFKVDLKFAVDGVEYTIAWDDLHIDTRNKSNVKINVKLLDELLRKREATLKKLKSLSIDAYFNLLRTLSQYQGQCLNLSNVIGQTDLYLGMAAHAMSSNYCKPEIKPDENLSWVNAVQLRHPMVEKRVQYIPQTIQLGNGNGNDGMLLYGVNQSGKSCTMKSLGVAIIMAQAGFYVPATEFTYYPFKTLMTRILGNDNMDRGLSAYAVEMTELRSILKRADDRTIVLGDEICHGTESASAVSLVSASIMHLIKQKTKFIFATHLHELSQMPEVTELERLQLYHLTIDYEDDKIIYDRKLKKGSGKCLYGLEVAKHLRLPKDVIAQAYAIRDRYYRDSEAVVTKTSRYNADKVINKCGIKNCKQSAEHTHHIRYQSEANDIGYVTESMHKNNKDNLVGLCYNHHQHVHIGDDEGQQLVIFGYNNSELKYKYRRMLKSLA